MCTHHCVASGVDEIADLEAVALDVLLVLVYGGVQEVGQ